MKAAWQSLGEELKKFSGTAKLPIQSIGVVCGAAARRRLITSAGNYTGISALSKRRVQETFSSNGYY